MKWMTLPVVVFLLLIVPFSVIAEEEVEDDSGSLAKAAQNPLASMVSLPMQFNYNTGMGEYNRTFFNLNIQPVVPFPGEKWNIITRTIIPINSVPIGETGSEFGIGDTTMSIFASPAGSGKLTWGVGPIIGLPTASNPEVLGSDKWGLGPTGVLFFATGKWTMGGVASNLWSVAGTDSREEYNILVAQYFVNFNFGQGWAVGSAPILTCNWEAESGNQWTIPWGLQVSKVTKFGSQPVNLLLGSYFNSEQPDGAADAQVRFQLNFLFPQKQ
jgi:hypothetical protein